MPRLRTTSTLSLIALAVGIAGTGWLSTLTSQWAGVSTHPARLGSSHGTISARRRHVQAGRVILPVVRRVEAKPVEMAVMKPAHAAQAPDLLPLSMPADESQPWHALQGHLDGRVTMHLAIDGDGRVRAARVVDSSGDPVLDEHAVRSVRGWRFAVPADHPDGIEGDLPMRFASADRQIARAP